MKKLDWKLVQIVDHSISWWIVKTTGPMQRFRYKDSDYPLISFSVLSWIDSSLPRYESMTIVQDFIYEGKWKI